MQENKGLYHFLAVLTVAIWGATFVSTKILINNGLSPNEIFFYRFLIAYAGIWIISHKRLFADNWKDELLLACAGVFGGSLYFLTENTALGITQASNVSFLLCGTPILTTVLSKIFSGTRRSAVWYMSVRLSPWSESPWWFSTGLRL